MLMRELIQAYMATNTKRSVRSDRGHATWWSSRFGALSIETISAEMIAEARADLEAKQLSPQTVLHYLKFLRRLLNLEVKARRLAVSPFTHVTLPKVHPIGPRILTQAEESAILNELGSPYAGWAKLALLTGLKKTEQFTLRWEQVDLGQGRIFLPRSDGRGVQYVPLCPDAISLFRGFSSSHKSAWVFPAVTLDRPLDVRSFAARVWVPAVKRARIPWCTWEDLRHTFAGRLAQQGVDQVTIAMLMRHSSPAQAQRYFSSSPVAGKAAVCTLSLPPNTGESALTFGEALALYFTHHLSHRSSFARTRRLAKQHLGSWMARPLDSIRRRDLIVFQSQLRASPTTANKVTGLVKAVFNWAIMAEYYAGANPAQRLRPISTESRARFLSVAETEQLLQALAQDASPRLRALVLTVLLTGARPGEVRTMCWRDIDLPARRWRKPKTKTGRPHIVPLPHQVITALTALQSSCQWVFPGEGDWPWMENSTQKVWKVFRRKAGLPDVWLYDLRRTCASWLAIQGENLSTIQKVLNHAGLQHTAVYARLDTQTVDRALQAQADRIWALHPSMTIDAAAVSPYQPSPQFIEQVPGDSVVNSSQPR